MRVYRTLRGTVPRENTPTLNCSGSILSQAGFRYLSTSCSWLQFLCCSHVSKPIQSSVMRSKRWVWLSVRERNQKLFRLSRDLGTLLLIFLETPLEEVCTDWEGSVSLNVGMWKVPQLHSGTTVYIGVGSQTPNSSYSKISTHDGQVWVSSSTRSWEVSKAPNPDCTDDTDLELEVHIWSRFQYLPFLLLHQSLWSMPKHK